MNWVVCRTDKQNEQITKINKADTHDRDPVYNPHSKFNHTKEDRVQLKPDGTRWRTGGEVKGKLVNGVGSQYSSLPRNMVYPALLPLMRTPRLPVVDWTDAPADLNALVRFAERRNLVSARVPSHFRRSLTCTEISALLCTDGLTKATGWFYNFCSRHLRMATALLAMLITIFSLGTFNK